MGKVATVSRGSTGQVLSSCLVHPDLFNYDEDGNIVSVRTVWVPIEEHINSGKGTGFYLAKGFVDPAQFLEYEDYKKFAKANKAAAKSFEEEALEDDKLAAKRAKDEAAEQEEAQTADAKRRGALTGVTSTKGDA